MLCIACQEEEADVTFWEPLCMQCLLNRVKYTGLAGNEIYRSECDFIRKVDGHKRCKECGKIASWTIQKNGSRKHVCYQCLADECRNF